MTDRGFPRRTGGAAVQRQVEQPAPRAEVEHCAVQRGGHDLRLPADQVDKLTGDLLTLIQKTAYELESDPKLRDQLVLLSEKHMSEVFNPKYKDDPSTLYLSYAGRTNLRTGIGPCDDAAYKNEPSKLDAAQGPLIGTALFLEEGKAKVNDGLVTIESAKWGKFEECVPADHLKEVGQLGPIASSFDHVAMFNRIVDRIRQAGF